jgi:hypothetical protein
LLVVLGSAVFFEAEELDVLAALKEQAGNAVEFVPDLIGYAATEVE